MAPSQMNLCVVLLVIVLLPIVMAAGESPFIGKDPCHVELSANYKGVCIGLINDAACNSVCIGENSNNAKGYCNFFQCWCEIRCKSETEAVASSPIRQ
ncbi:hypothetical protein BDA96_10G291900 [Sorghum bicolor]|uniref:Knottins-like domain-containing protein n=2 Tax=Sorghum bicolor TaxID=4558 RepID=A0A1W0VUA5_SORBI|nr:hypothetical protein BDA96_10G291900 [Sorghum bicolor]OQU76869.1 hypothetical protein SORBI_3010G225276 [Sorghum bicolor]